MSDERTFDQTDPLIGLLVDERYRVTRRLARGGMATVYVAQDERLDRPVALKVMHPHLADSDAFVERFRREARSAARIVHPGVVSVFDQGVVTGQGFLVMELIDGTNLRQLLRAQGAFTIPQALRYTTDTLEALRAAHRVGVIHRDIKPENILVPSDGPAKVTDFGLARAASEVSMSSTGNMLGTVAYIAPEIATTAEADARSDIYSVGIMLYEMLTGAVPWAGESPLQIASHHVSDDVPSPSAAQPWIPREIDDLVAALTAREPANRPADASDAIDLVARAAAAIPSNLANRRAEVAPGERHRASETSALNTEIMSAQFTRPLPAPASSSVALVHTSGATQAAQAASPPKKSARAAAWIALVVLLLVVAGLGGRWWWTEYGPGSYLTMPETTGRTLTDVQADLDALGLRTQVEEEFSDDVDTGSVTRSDPEGGSSVHKRAEVQLYVSKGVDMKTVPEVTGKSQDEAQRSLTDAGLAVGAVTDAYSEDVPQGQVISQSVAAGTSLAHDSAVDIVLSKGREPLTVPTLSGLSASAAKSAIEDLGLVAAPTEAYSDTVAEGQVISQQTREGSTLHRGDSVAYTVSKGPEKVAIPDVVGLQREEARSLLEGAGFTVKEEAILGGFFGTVRSSDPAAGTMTKKGSTVTITIV
ncbi:Stk1 family PASTA domain-containing Ser/Thr kinase [Schaalia odontolytica]|uniref:Stk1 family PASTA domain-containing Ser/Thr kinase n=1 Tax=Schaalia odontolytica TaxID=1660 RepID=UPI001D07AF57|nr:Stk1 family PASTA domain-containing Ser/Thr kinase [Schaalia odontolytica]MCB6401145.1 Stk1 family PASTA domain-containing Ser/Thr kinase [Schaalia odontolytica]